MSDKPNFYLKDLPRHTSLPPEGASMLETAYREPGRQLIENAIQVHLVTARNLQALLDSIPVKLSPEADEALWQIALNARPR